MLNGDVYRLMVIPGQSPVPIGVEGANNSSLGMNSSQSNSFAAAAAANNDEVSRILSA